MKNAVLGAAILAVLVGLAGCGQRGPLYLPTPPQVDQATEKGAPERTRR